jgi:hypothetical protein
LIDGVVTGVLMEEDVESVLMEEVVERVWLDLLEEAAVMYQEQGEGSFTSGDWISLLMSTSFRFGLFDSLDLGLILVCSTISIVSSSEESA